MSPGQHESPRKLGRPDASMTLITEMMQRPLDPAYAAAAESRQKSGLPPATGRRSPLLVIFAVLIGAMLATSAMALRAPTTAARTIKSDLVSRIEASRAHVDAQTRRVATLRAEIDSVQAAALSDQSQDALAAELSTLELAAGTVAVSGPGVLLTVDDAEVPADPQGPDVDPDSSTGFDKGKVLARDLQIIVNGLWDAGAEAISINGHRLTTRAAIRGAGAAILVGNTALTRPYVISAIGDAGDLSVEFADNDGGSYLQFLRTNARIRGDIQERDPVVVLGQPALSLQEAQPVQSAVTKPATSSARTTPTITPTTAPQTTETAP